MRYTKYGIFWCCRYAWDRGRPALDEGKMPLDPG